MSDLYRRKFSQEFKDELRRVVIETSKPVVDVARAYGVGAESLRQWLINYREAHGGNDTELGLPERAQLKALEAEVRELRAEGAFIEKPPLTSRGSHGDGEV